MTGRSLALMILTFRIEGMGGKTGESTRQAGLKQVGEKKRKKDKKKR
jgi:hypothetical protein